MLHLANFTLVVILWLNLLGLSLATSAITKIRSGWLNLTLGPWLLCSACFFVEFFHGFGDLHWVWPLTTLASAGLIYLSTRREPLKNATLRKWQRRIGFNPWRQSRPLPELYPGLLLRPRLALRLSRRGRQLRKARGFLLHLLLPPGRDSSRAGRLALSLPFHAILQLPILWGGLDGQNLGDGSRNDLQPRLLHLDRAGRRSGHWDLPGNRQIAAQRQKIGQLARFGRMDFGRFRSQRNHLSHDHQIVRRCAHAVDTHAIRRQRRLGQPRQSSPRHLHRFLQPLVESHHANGSPRRTLRLFHLSGRLSPDPFRILRGLRGRPGRDALSPGKAGPIWSSRGACLS